MDPKRLLAIGTGVGIEIGRHELRVVVARVRPSGAAIAGWTAIAGFRDRPAAEWGSEYSEFLKRTGAAHLAATALLPRSEVIVRLIGLPGVPNRDLASAVTYRIDALHPYGEDEVHYAWARIPQTSSVLVAIAKRAVVDRYAALFGEAGLKVASLTFSAAAIYSGARLLASPPPGGFLALAESDGETEVYGESPARPLLSAVPDVPADQAVRLAAAELRLDPESESEPLALSQLLPVPRSAPADCDSTRAALAYAAALAGACPRLGLAANLLPPEHRSASSRAMFIPTVALASALLLLVVGLGAQGMLKNRRYLAKLEAEVARLEPQVRRIQQLERESENARGRIRLLDEFRRRTKSDLDALTELTKLVKAPAWLNGLDLSRGSLAISGEADQAAPLLKTLDSSPFFKNSEFTIPLSRTSKSELFRIHASREGGTE